MGGEKRDLSARERGRARDGWRGSVREEEGERDGGKRGGRVGGEQRVPPSTIRRPGVAFIHFTRVCYPRTSTIPMHPLGPASGAPIDRLGVQKKMYVVAIDDRCPQTSAFGYICTPRSERRTCDYRASLLFHLRAASPFFRSTLI